MSTRRRLAAFALLGFLLVTSDAAAANRIAGGYTPHPSNWPWVTALVQKGTNSLTCTATLIAPQRVLTAGHCISTPDGTWSAGQLQALVGRRALSNEGEGERINVRSIAIHPNYAYPSSGAHAHHLSNDVAILFLDRPSTLQPAPVGNAQTWGSSATVMGWGHTNHDHDPADQIPATDLRAADLDVWTDNQCRAATDSDTGQHYFPEIHMCAGDADNRDCVTHGDSGGPLMVRTDGVWELVGVTSFYPVADNMCAVTGFAWAAGPALRDWILTVPEPAPDASISMAQAARYLPTVIGQNVRGRIRGLRRNCVQDSATQIRCGVAWRIGRATYRGQASFFHVVENGEVRWNYSLRGTRRVGTRASRFAWGA